MKLSHKILLALALITVGIALSRPTTVSAHAHPKVMVPVPDSTGPSPAKVSITFSEAVEPKFSSINVTSPDGKTKFNISASQPVAGDPKTLTLALPTLSAGAYLVKWVSVAPDGHRLEGEYTFNVK